ncbi:hypothetical protein [Mycobacterium riyadhense]|uniref:EthD domain-containing protein n=1 Tax=Mycobacterium riyadhense TaxID=486698 RepID=A0A653EM55_9MYCO|nr:hypothetical protein [Mycobacterium riyadhense]VTO97940.1 hypothetical protein BIN_B_02323 [Mycobacterium riyadhense]
MSNEMIVVGLTVAPEDEAEFTEFYHHRHIPKLLACFPEIVSARRYVEHNVDGTLRYYAKQQLTFYELAHGVDGTRCLADLTTRGGRDAERLEWASWAQGRLRGLEPARLYRQRYEHLRKPPGGVFCGPFFMVSVETRPERKDRFDRWYEETYLPRNVADVPLWSGCRRYESVGRSPEKQLTVYEATDTAKLAEALEQMRAPYRLAENASWSDWDSGADPAIVNEDATSFRPVFRYPD